MKGFCPLASGSKGNSIFFGTEQTKILIDAGLSARATKEKLDQIGIKIEDLDAILITHEHGDHIAGLRVMALKMGIPVFANNETAKGIVEVLRECPKFKIFSTGETFEFQDLEIHPFSISHDTLDPVAFTIKCNNLKLGFCTDLGFASSLVENHLKNCDYLYVEANHQVEWVFASSRPDSYKQRVLSRSGHLSNESCGKLLSKVAHKNLKHVHLAHLSSECNAPEVALSVVKNFLIKEWPELPISVAFQHMLSKAILF
ncbi:MAG TPA: MBL fold metallo-hydrolase [Parachlamydiaceae bacterium]|nr:MBL fold metallo-hydrolase [Parachlamydiaceae bacterium]